MNKLNPSLKYHLLVGVFISFWGAIFAFLARPFDTGISLTGWIRIALGFNLVTFLAYLCISIIQKYVYEKTKKWSYVFELATLLLYHILFTLGTFAFYKSSILNGDYSFYQFNVNITLRLALITLPVITIVRVYLIKLLPIKEDILTIKGENKLDILKVKKTELICISNAQNYVEIFYLQGETLHSKLIRSSLKSLQKEFDFLLQIHRSHLINPFHFKSWKNQNTISLTEMELPVSKSYKEQVLSL